MEGSCWTGHCGWSVDEMGLGLGAERCSGRERVDWGLKQQVYQCMRFDSIESNLTAINCYEFTTYVNASISLYSNKLIFYHSGYHADKCLQLRSQCLNRLKALKSSSNFYQLRLQQLVSLLPSLQPLYPLSVHFLRHLLVPLFFFLCCPSVLDCLNSSLEVLYQYDTTLTTRMGSHLSLLFFFVPHFLLLCFHRIYRLTFGSALFV